MTNQTKWSIDPVHSEISFKVKHLMITNVKGSFKIFNASIYTTEKDFTTAGIDLWIDAASITTGDTKRDDHLRGADFFDVQNHKQITFTSETIGKPDLKGNQEVWGELTMKGVTKNIKLRVRFGGIINDPWGNERAGFTVTGKICRNDWGLTWNAAIEAGGLMVSEEVIITCEVELINIAQSEFTMELDPTTAKIGTM
jgi:polyisoprenoid-binding protein YceI